MNVNELCHIAQYLQTFNIRAGPKMESVKGPNIYSTVNATAEKLKVKSKSKTK